ncbi:hypothetical protein OTERR_20670 [Oryzomicrobium terrae]|uniref:Uncharacterized protein n=1 Tax=Oryzomicrobium terrae TaxID=1735038 RepID=A0A5C1E9J4_9RHOO|nr:hypothetical protein [Oryzomicrobium terrae]QEL65543.1 hypothetical protein OTERR_20670 [Oryzomicrobium terrae]
MAAVGQELPLTISSLSRNSRPNFGVGIIEFFIRMPSRLFPCPIGYFFQHNRRMKNLIRISEKLKEADFFLRQMTRSHGNIEELNYYFSAFVSAARSVTFVLQYVGSVVEGFDSWYADVQSRQRSDKVAKYLLEARNESQKTGAQPIAYGEVIRLPSGEETLINFFSYIGSSPPAEVPDMDVLTTCNHQMRNLVQIVIEFFDKFEDSVWDASQEKRSTVENLSSVRHKIHGGETPDVLWQQLVDVIGGTDFLPPRPSQEIIDLRKRYE